MTPAPRLHIVVPYRDRAAHLRKFAAHMRAYFARDTVAGQIPYRVTIVEQEPGLPFNRGALKNIGFLLGEADSAYTCFHDVDYLPLWADYRWADRPTGILWYGAEQRPVAPGKSGVLLFHDMETLYGGVMLVPNAIFRQADGYSNAYWGWGFEDRDVVRRFGEIAVACARRKGTFSALDHESDGYDASGVLTLEGAANAALFARKGAQGAGAQADGLSTLRFEILAREHLADPQPEPDAVHDAVYEKVLVRLRRD